MTKIFSIVLLIVAIAYSGWFGENYQGYGDTSVVQKFKADSLKYTRIFSGYSYKDLRIDVMASDTSTAGFSADSLNFAWGVQTGHPVYNASGLRDTAWNSMLIVLDTCEQLDSLYTPACAGSYVVMSTTGTYTKTRRLKDTLSVTGFTKMTAQPDIDYDIFIRGFVKGLTGNDKGSFLKLMFTFFWGAKE